MQPKRLVLFDIDGTVLHGGPLWKECFIAAFEHYFPQFKFPRVSFGGRTDLQICWEMMKGAGFSDAEIRENLTKVANRYLDLADEAAQTRAHEVVVLPGVIPLLDELNRNENILLGLLTGNIKRGAYSKLSCVDLQDYFKFGVFGDDDWDRYKLPSLAVTRVKSEFGFSFEGKQIVIIGDTIHDVNCGKSLGVRTIAVGTGRGIAHTDLLAQDPDFFFPDLSATFDVMQAILTEMDKPF